MASRKNYACGFAHDRSRRKVKPLSSKGERISQFVEQLAGSAEGTPDDVANDPYYQGFFRCWNEQRYYEAHDVLEHIWLKTTTDDGLYFKGLIQAAGAFVHLQKQYEHPTHPKHGRRLYPAVRLFRLALNNLSAFGPQRHAFDVAGFREMLGRHENVIVESDHRTNPWSPESAPLLSLLN